MTQDATPASALGNFDQHLTVDGHSFHLRVRNDQLVMETITSTQNIRRPVVLSTGSHHMQAYWFSIADDSRILAMLPFIHLNEQNRWIPRNAAFLKPPQPLTDEVGRWNHTCIKCHVTNGRFWNRNVDDPNALKIREANTSASEFGISCEACHGPGGNHVNARQMGTQMTSTEIANPSDLSHRLSSQVCGQCHSVYGMQPDALADWMANGWAFRPGDDFSNSKMRYLVRCDADYKLEYSESWPTMFWSDGMVRVSGREYTGLASSPCFERGQMSCLTCHRMHQESSDDRPQKEWADDQLSSHALGNDACLECHSEFRGEDLSRHTRHVTNSTGSQCYNCHMPHTTYGLLKAIRSHQISSPNISDYKDTGRPIACNQCHLDQTIAWTSHHLQDWYGQPEYKFSQEERDISASLLWLLKGDAGQRALAAWTFGWPEAVSTSGEEWFAPHLAELLEDPYDAVRYIAQRSLRRVVGFEKIQYDFVAPSSVRSAQMKSVQQKWSSMNHPAIIQPQSKLMHKDGTVDIVRQRQILQQRNDRTVHLAE